MFLFSCVTGQKYEKKLEKYLEWNKKFVSLQPVSEKTKERTGKRSLTILMKDKYKQ